tara:strand:- start:15467 stop:16882 length:1416 start_codon:yes stop_codon:yes gene_type:complete
MSASLQKTEFKQVKITPENKITFKRGGSSDSSKQDSVDSLDIKNSVVQFDYFEDLLSPAISVRLLVSDTSALLSKIPIRGYERIDLIIGTAYGDVEFTEENGNPLYVSSIEKVNQVEGQEVFTLKCCTLTNLSNETTRVMKRYGRQPISEHVKSILTDDLKIDPDRMSVERSLTNYGFIGNMRKPFYTIQWLCPKAVPSTSPVSGQSGKGTSAEGKGTSGFFFYEDYDGYKFKSVDRMVDATQVDYPTGDGETLKSKYGIPTYTYSTLITANDPENEFKILHAMTNKTTDVQKNLRVGLYSNLTYVYDPLDWKLDVVKYNLEDNVKDENLKTAGGIVPIPQGDITKLASRVLVRMGDRGMWNPELEESEEAVEGQGRDSTDMAKAFTRYTMLFQQSLNITVPCNPTLRIGRVIRVELPEVGPTYDGPSGRKKSDSEQSGFFVIRSLRHHFEIAEGKNVTSLNLIRDSYGIQ